MPSAARLTTGWRTSSAAASCAIRRRCANWPGSCSPASTARPGLRRHRFGMSAGSLSRAAGQAVMPNGSFFANDPRLAVQDAIRALCLAFDPTSAAGSTSFLPRQARHWTPVRTIRPIRHCPCFFSSNPDGRRRASMPCNPRKALGGPDSCVRISSLLKEQHLAGRSSGAGGIRRAERDRELTVARGLGATASAISVSPPTAAVHKSGQESSAAICSRPFPEVGLSKPACSTNPTCGTARGVMQGLQPIQPAGKA